MQPIVHQGLLSRRVSRVRPRSLLLIQLLLPDGARLLPFKCVLLVEVRRQLEKSNLRRRICTTSARSANHFRKSGHDGPEYPKPPRGHQVLVANSRKSAPLEMRPKWKNQIERAN
ncbi:hypothetical protein L596_011435 [Steinernema carpocapsae]|uniref:Uncharacterized protein n=1 Tax=Steinernema carpocapsae TaxID=34508 RepID=A0A4U5NUU1_STECR|nr:hypothetical protein L596_011435 [Steinernema carpocapsae]